MGGSKNKQQQEKYMRVLDLFKRVNNLLEDLKLPHRASKFDVDRCFYAVLVDQ